MRKAIFCVKLLVFFTLFVCLFQFQIPWVVLVFWVRQHCVFSNRRQHEFFFMKVGQANSQHVSNKNRTCLLDAPNRSGILTTPMADIAND